MASADAITLEWDSSSDPIEGYKLYVGTESGTYTETFNVGAATTFTYTNAIAGQRYCFAVTAYASPTLESPQSNEVCGYSDAPPVLTNPGNQSSAVGQPTSLQLAATDPDGQAVTYSATGLPPGFSLGASTGFISGSGTTAGNYGVQVTASDGVLTSSQSFTWAMGTTPPPLPSSPDSATLTAEVVDREYPQRVQLSWTASWTEVWVYRDGILIVKITNAGAAFTDYIRVASGTGTYTYQVCGPDGTACSNSVTVTF